MLKSYRLQSISFVALVSSIQGTVKLLHVIPKKRLHKPQNVSVLSSYLSWSNKMSFVSIKPTN